MQTGLRLISKKLATITSKLARLESPVQISASLQVSLPYVLPPPSFPNRSGSLIGFRSEGSPVAEDHSPLWTSEELTDQRQVISINTLPDDVLVAIFYHCVSDDDAQHITVREEAWKAWESLVHVCRRWRSIIFASPRHLKLWLVCTERTPTRDRLDIWPALPLVIRNYYSNQLGLTDNVIAALERCDRVCRITFGDLSSSDMEIYLAATAMQQPFPELTYLLIYSYSTTVRVVPDSFLGGSAPRLEFLTLDRIPFPGLPKLLLSATHLVTLHLYHIPHSGYFSPEAMAIALFTLTSLEDLTLRFQSPLSCPDQASRRLPPSTRSVLPVLTRFLFKGVTEYLEDLVARIDAPRLNTLDIFLFNDIVFDTPQLIQFISRTSTSRALEKAHITLQSLTAILGFSSQTSGNWKVWVKILCRGLNWQLSSLEQVCAQCLPSLSMLEDLYIYEERYSRQNWKDDIENGLWLQLLHPFTSVKNLYLSKPLALRIGPALQELAEGRTMEVLPALQNIFLEGLESSGSVQEGITKFVAARQVASRPIAASDWANAYSDKVYHDSDW